MRTSPELSLSNLQGRVPVVLVGGINLVRCLGLAGIPAIVASSDPDEPAFASRHCAGRLLLPSLASAAAVEVIATLGQRLCDTLGTRVPLMYGNDDALRLVHAHRERLAKHYLLLLNDCEVAEALIEKDRFQAFAESRGLPVPVRLAWDGIGPGTVAATSGPVLVKPRDKVDWYESSLRVALFNGEAKAKIFASGAAAAQDAVVARHHAQLLFQQYVPGGDEALWSYHGLADDEGRVLAAFIGRKVRTHPPLTGESAFIEIAHDDALEAVAREVAARVPLKGLFKMDFKRDAADGRWYLLEVNARCTLWHYLGARNGVNLMRAAYDYLVDGTLPAAQRARTTYRWLSLDLDWRAYRMLAARGELSFARWAWSIARSRNVYNVFAWHDPRPWLAFWRDRLVRRYHRGSGRLLTALRQWRSTAS